MVRIGERHRGRGRRHSGRARAGKVDRLKGADGLLRPALEAAVVVARAGEDAVPARPAPAALRPFLHFARLPARALVAARRVLDADQEFRDRVVEEVSEDDVGRAGWIFLSRPRGWEEELEELLRAAAEAEAEVAERRAESDVRRRLRIAEETVRRAEEAAAQARAEAARAAEALAEQRRSRRAAERRVGELSASVAALTAERDRARAGAEASAAAAAAARRRAEEAMAEAATLRRASPPAAGPSEPPPAPHEPPAATPPAELTAPALSSEVAGEALAAAAQAARRLAEGLEAAAAALGAPPREDSDDEGDVLTRVGTTGFTGGAPLSPSSPSPAARPTGRTPAPLPPGMLEDSPEAAAHLVRRRGVVLLVDGYNVSQAGWPGLSISEQRRRLVDALGELAARTAADVRVVFDGSDVGGPAPVATTPQAVRVRFSPPGTEADDVIVAEVAEIPRGRPVVVVSSDHRVRDESRVRGANLLRSSQLLGLLR